MFDNVGIASPFSFNFQIINFRSLVVTTDDFMDKELVFTSPSTARLILDILF